MFGFIFLNFLYLKIINLAVRNDLPYIIPSYYPLPSRSLDKTFLTLCLTGILSSPFF